MKVQHFGVFLVLLFCLPLWGCKDDESVSSEIEYDYSVLSKDNSYLVFLGDTQGYFNSVSNAKFFSGAIGWIAGAFNKGYDISAMLHPGDVTDYNSYSEWVQFRNAMLSTDLSMPIVVSAGNHDYKLVERNGQFVNESRDLSFFRLFINYPQSLMVDSYEGEVENVLLKISIGSTEWYILSLEFGPRQEVLDWAAGCVGKFKESPFLVLTHAYLYNGNDLYASNTKAIFQQWAPKYYFKDASDGLDIWNALIRENDNVKMVLCGHISFSAVVVSENDLGSKVLKLRFDPSNQPNGGDGWLQLLEFSKKNHSESGSDGFELNGFIYNPITNKLMEDVAGDFTLNF